MKRPQMEYELSGTLVKTKVPAPAPIPTPSIYIPEKPNLSWQDALKATQESELPKKSVSEQDKNRPAWADVWAPQKPKYDPIRGPEIDPLTGNVLYISDVTDPKEPAFFLDNVNETFVKEDSRPLVPERDNVHLVVYALIGYLLYLMFK